MKKLLHFKYSKHKPSKIYLILYLGEDKEKIIGLISDLIPIAEARLISKTKASGEVLHRLIREDMKETYSKAVRTFDKEYIKVLNEYPMKPS